jgi:hypothetical protein
MYYDPFESYREAQRNLNQAVRKAVTIQRIDMPKIIEAQKVALQLQPDWSAITRAATIDREAISQALSMQQTMVETMSKLSRSSFRLEAPNMDSLFESAHYMNSIARNIQPIRLDINTDLSKTINLVNSMQTRSMLYNVSRLNDQAISDYIESDETVEDKKAELVTGVLVYSAFAIIAWNVFPIAFSPDVLFQVRYLLFQQLIQAANEKAKREEDKDD